MAFAAVAGTAWFFVRNTGIIFLRPLAMLSGWDVVVAIASLLPKLRFGSCQVLILLGVATALGLPGRLYLKMAAFGTGTPMTPSA